MFKKKIAEPSVLERMEAALYLAIIVPFAGQEVAVIARELTHAQIESCGKFTLIETFQDKIFKKEKVTFDEMSKYAETQYNILKLSLINPTYEEIFKIVTKYNDIESIEKQLQDIQTKFDEAEITGEKIDLKTMKEEFAILEMQARFCFPADFVSHTVSFALGIGNSDIKLVSEEMLYNAAVKAKIGHDNPADHLHGNFSDFNKEDINNRAWIIYQDKQKGKKDGG